MSIVKGGKRRNKKISKKLLFWSKIFFTDGKSGQKIRAILLTTCAHEQHARGRERERERERGSTFSERKMSATPSALKASSREENAEEENVLVSRDDDEEEGEEREEREERERGASVGKEEEQEECVVFFFSLVIYF